MPDTSVKISLATTTDTAGIETILTGLLDIQKGLDKSSGQWSEFTKELGKKFTLPALGQQLLGSLGLDSALGIAQKAADLIVKPFKEAAESAQKIATLSEQTLAAVKARIRLHQTDEQYLASLKKEQESDERRLAELNKPKTISHQLPGFHGQAPTTRTETVERSKEEKEEAATLARNIAVRAVEIDTTQMRSDAAKAQKVADEAAAKQHAADETKRQQEEKLRADQEAAKKAKETADQTKKAEAQTAKEADAAKIKAQLDREKARDDELTKNLTASATQQSEIESNNLLTQQEKNLVLEHQLGIQRLLNDARLAEIKAERAKLGKNAPPEETAYYDNRITQLTKDINQLRTKLIGIESTPTKGEQDDKNKRDLADPSKHYQSGAEGIDASFAAQTTDIGTWGDRLNRTFTQVGQGIRNSLGTAFSDMLLKGGSFVSKLHTLWNSLVTNFAQAGAKMVADWVYQHVVMSTVRRLFHATDTALTNAEVLGHATGEGAKTTATAAGSVSRGAIRVGETIAHGVQVALRTAAHWAGEAAKTAASLLGSLARRAIHLGETIFHGVQVALRTAAHLAGEAVQTATTVAQSASRITAILAESAVYLVKAALGALSALASIPYVGPFLAVAAMAAILAQGGKLLKGHAEGGYTVDVAHDQPAGVVHGGEWVAPAWQVDHPLYGPMIANLEAARQGKPGYKWGGWIGSRLAGDFIYGGPKEFLPKFQRTFAEHYNLINGSALYGSAAAGDTPNWQWDTNTQSWVKASGDVAGAMTPPAQAPSSSSSASSGYSAAGAAGGGTAAGSGAMINVALFDDRNTSAYEQFIRDPRATQYIMSVVQANRRQLNIRV